LFTPALKTSLCIAATLLLIVPLLMVEADARMGGSGGGGGRGFGGGGFGGGHSFGGMGHIGGGGRGFGGGGFGGGHSFGGMGHIGGMSRGFGGVGISRGGGFAGRSISSTYISRGGGVNRSFGGRIGSRSVTGSRVSTARMTHSGTATNRLATAGTRSAAAGALHASSLARTGTLAHNANLARAHAVFGAHAIGNVAWRGRFGWARFGGRFCCSFWPWWWGGVAIGWFGPLFWPYAYWDFFDYVYWPYAYDDFWPYAYNDIYYGIYGPYAYSGYAAANPGRVPRPGPGAASSSPRRVVTRTPDGEQRAADVCTSQASELTDWPVERISEVVQPTDAQRPLLDELKTANAKAIGILQGACPNDLPSIPTGRLAAMENRLQVMLAAVQTIRPVLDRFYQSLSDEQKARFNAVEPASEAAAGQDRRNFTSLCEQRRPDVTDLPIDRIAQAVRPTPEQQASLDALKDASLKAAESLKADCPSYQALTPTGRVEAMERRLQAMLSAVRTVKPALTRFYDGLSDEQKARFNALRSATRPAA
jgi:LTXXQ motif family protein